MQDKDIAGAFATIGEAIWGLILALLNTIILPIDLIAALIVPDGEGPWADSK